MSIKITNKDAREKISELINLYGWKAYQTGRHLDMGHGFYYAYNFNKYGNTLIIRLDPKKNRIYIASDIDMKNDKIIKLNYTDYLIFSTDPKKLDKWEKNKIGIVV